MAKVSVVIPVYNVDKYLEKCLKSVQNQTLEDMEIICVDDGSTDESGKILDLFAKQNSRFIVIHKENEGYGKAVNIGIKKATAPYIGIVESDDWIDDNMYKELYEIIESEDVDLVKADHYEFYEGYNNDVIEKYIPIIANEDFKPLYNKKIFPSEHEEIFRFSKYTWTGLYKRKFLIENQIFHNETPGASYQDTGFWFLSLAKANTVYFLNKAFYHYKIDNPNASMFNKSKPESVKSEYGYIEEKLDIIDDNKSIYKKWIKSFLVNDLWLMLRWAEDKRKKEIAADLRERILNSIEKKELMKDFFSTELKAELMDILIDSEKYVDRMIEQDEKLFKNLDSASEIIIYGAGKIAIETYNKLQFYRQYVSKIKSFAVTRMEDNAKMIGEIPVQAIDDLKCMIKTAVVIVAVGQKLKRELYEEAFVRGFQNIIFVDELF